MRTSAILAAAFACSLGLGSAASAQTAGAFMANPAFKDPRPKTCDNTFDMQHCAAADLRRADAAMSAAYRKALAASTEPGSAEKLKTAQRTWLAFRDQECPWEGSLYGNGSFAGPSAGLCWVAVTTARTAQLKATQQP